MLGRRKIHRPWMGDSDIMKTRAFDPETKQWRTDYVIAADGTLWAIPEGCNVGWSRYSNMAIGDKVNWTLSRFTEHMDINKNEIYEHHIVKIAALGNDHHQKGAWEIRTVKYFMGNPCVCWKSQDTGTPLFPLMVDHKIEIIGDVFLNPELLEV